MRTPLLATVLTLGLCGTAWADARILLVQDATPPAAESQPAVQPESRVVPPPPAEPVAPAPAVEATTPAPPVATGRFRFEKNGPAYVRLDTETGQVAVCAPGGGGWTCDAVPEARAALEKDLVRQREEIGRLQNEIAGLKQEVAALREPPPPPRPPADLTPRPPAPKDGDLTIKLPTQEDIDRATAALQRAWDRVVDMIGNLTKDLSRKPPHADRTTL